MKVEISVCSELLRALTPLSENKVSEGSRCCRLEPTPAESERLNTAERPLVNGDTDSLLNKVKSTRSAESMSNSNEETGDN